MIKSRVLTRIYKTRNRKRKMLLIATWIASTGLTLSVVGVISMFVLVALLSPFLPDPNKLSDRSTDLSTRIADRNGKVLYQVFGEKNRTLVKFEDTAPNLINATLATEDATFYEHRGFYFQGIVRAMINIVKRQGLQSGSTITQQVAKNTLLSQERTVTRKIKELILALQMENNFTKEQILQLYLNETPYGGQNYGVFSASQSYFGKKPSELTLAESAYMAGLPQSPTYYSPYSTDPTAGLNRQKTVLKLMKEKGWVGSDYKRHYLSDEEYQQALTEELKFKKSSSQILAPHFVFYVKEQLVQKYGTDAVENGGLQVITTLDYDKQAAAEQIVKDELQKVRNLKVGNAGVVVLDTKTRQILTMIGSKDYFADSEPEGCISGITGKNSCTFEPALNTTLALRQPGSSIKPITYAAMLRMGYTASFPFLDVPTKFDIGQAKPYEPVNYDGKFVGPVSLRNALGNSRNIPAVKALKIVSVSDMIDLAHSMGITSLNDFNRYGLSLTLGGGETKVLDMANVYATFGSGGIYNDTVAILEVKDAYGNVLDRWQDRGGKRVLPEDVSYLISSILSDDGARSDAFGAGSLLNVPGHTVAVKTGTTDEKKDNHTYGYTPSFTVGVWVGNNNNDAMNPLLASGITGAAPIWRKVMDVYLKGTKDEPFKRPDTIIEADVDKLTGMQPYDDKPTRKEKFIKGTEPTTKSPWYLKLEICKKDGKLANDACREDDKTKTKNYIKILAELPEWQDAVNAWVADKYKDEDEYFPPTKTSKYPDD